MSRLNDHRSDLLAEWQRLSETWDDVRAKWRDQVKNEFEQQYWNEIEQQTKSYLEALASVSEAAHKLL